MAFKKTEENAVALRQQSILPSISQDELDLIGADLGAGLEEIDMRDMVIPYVKIIQQLSPEVNSRKPEHIEGAEVGDFMNSATKQLKKRLHVIPVAYRRRNVEWKKNRGGFVKDWGDDDSILARCTKDPLTGQLTTPDGNILQVQGTYFCIEISGPYPERCVIALASTQYKHSKEWMSKINGELISVNTPDRGVVLAKPPIWYRTYICDAQPESNDRGDWMGWKISSADKTLDVEAGKMFYNLARDFNSAVKSGEVKAEVETVIDPVRDEDIPF